MAKVHDTERTFWPVGWGGVGERLLIECKTSPPNSLRQLDQLLRQLFAYGTTNNDYKIVLAVPATLSDEYLFALKEAGVEVWDLNFLSREFSGVVHKIPGSYFAQIIVSHANRSHEPTNEEKFISSLRSCLPGKQDCYVYQKLIGEILGHLFTPPLYEPIPELSDKAKVNRRDFIMPNYVDSGFWAFLRERYSADYVVIDAKNYTKKVSKKDVLQIANYLKSHGAGLFGLIISRRGGDLSGCEVTLREQWLVHQKMIIILDDEDVVSMLLAKSDGRAPEQVIGSKIEQFRLSMYGLLFSLRDICDRSKLAGNESANHHFNLCCFGRVYYSRNDRRRCVSVPRSRSSHSQITNVSQPAS
ncbi:hypothetical protein [Pseudomonas aeruginosa]